MFVLQVLTEVLVVRSTKSGNGVPTLLSVETLDGNSGDAVFVLVVNVGANNIITNLAELVDGGVQEAEGGLALSSAFSSDEGEDTGLSYYEHFLWTKCKVELIHRRQVNNKARLSLKAGPGQRLFFLQSAPIRPIHSTGSGHRRVILLFAVKSSLYLHPSNAAFTAAQKASALAPSSTR